MDTKKKTAALLAAVIGVGVAAASISGVSAQSPLPTPVTGAERHPELRRALASLERTEFQLRHSARDFGGHRQKAADLCHQAQQEVQLALQSDRG